MGPTDKSTINPSAMDKLVTDGSNWPLWQATMKSFFESKNLIKHIEGIAARPLPPPTFAATHTIIDEEDACIESAEDRMEKLLAREGLVKSQVIISVSEPLALMLQKKNTAQEVWNALADEMTKKPKMVVTSLQRQLQNIKCSEEDDCKILYILLLKDIYAMHIYLYFRYYI